MLNLHIREIILAAAFPLTLLTGCVSTSVESPFQSKLDSLGLTNDVLRLKNIDRSLQIGLLLESASDSIINASDDLRIQQNARLWRSYALPGIRQALLFSDPAAASVDGWAYSFQMRDYLEKGDGRTMFGKEQEIAIRAAHAIEATFIEPQPEFAEQNAKRGRSIEAWAADHPMTNSFFARPSAIPFLKAMNLVSDGSVGGTVGNIGQDVHDISNRLTLFSTQLPMEARWQAEYMLGELKGQERIDSLQSQAVNLVATLKQLTNAISAGKITIDIRSLQQLHSDVLLLEGRIKSERQIVLFDLDRQRTETLLEIERFAKEETQGLSAGAIELIDHLMLRLAQILALAFVGIVIILVAIFFVRRGRSTINQTR